MRHDKNLTRDRARIYGILTVLVVLAFLLTGCAEIAAMRSGIARYGANGADQTLDTALWTICFGSPIGAINRRFQSDSQRQAYLDLCADEVADPAIPGE
jgi:hypothetical protein